jgi:hypothetical protein
MVDSLSAESINFGGCRCREASQLNMSYGDRVLKGSDRAQPDGFSRGRASTSSSGPGG